MDIIQELYATQLAQLQEMGFFNPQENIQALVATAGNVHAPVARLLGNPEEEAENPTNICSSKWGERSTSTSIAVLSGTSGASFRAPLFKSIPEFFGSAVLTETRLSMSNPTWSPSGSLKTKSLFVSNSIAMNFPMDVCAALTRPK
ncbi:hypothetical protein Leryth_002489 [Lithospermum erythrorhizon]|nr:hypothetical protein Leryth_002489 [Lithospermum erythrorhizon]